MVVLNAVVAACEKVVVACAVVAVVKPHHRHGFGLPAHARVGAFKLTSVVGVLRVGTCIDVARKARSNGCEKVALTVVHPDARAVNCGALIVKVVALPEARLKPLETCFRINKARCDGGGDLIGFAHTVPARIFVGVKKLGKAGVNHVRVKKRNLALVALGNVGVKEPGLQGLHRVASEKRHVLFKNKARIH